MTQFLTRIPPTPDETRTAAYALETAGPRCCSYWAALVGLVVARSSPTAALAGTALLPATGATALLTQQRRVPSSESSPDAPRSRLRTAGSARSAPARYPMTFLAGVFITLAAAALLADPSEDLTGGRCTFQQVNSYPISAMVLIRS